MDRILASLDYLNGPSVVYEWAKWAVRSSLQKASQRFGSFPAHGPVRQGRRITQPPSPRAAPRRRTSQRRRGTSPCAARLARWDSSPRGGSACREQRRGGGGLADSSPELPETPTGPLLSPDALRREIRGEWPDWPRARRLSLQVPTARLHPPSPPSPILTLSDPIPLRFQARPRFGCAIRLPSAA
jgi:hypothetical protein